jgi:hypothetical protein
MSKSYNIYSDRRSLPRKSLSLSKMRDVQQRIEILFQVNYRVSINRDQNLRSAGILLARPKSLRTVFANHLGWRSTDSENTMFFVVL